ncbi:transposase [Streptomyces sp. ME19-01-6]|uniref:RNA-guided endonuclease InsQ/TnpB family protein n=1 Tax=Streptomyces sp. ME19-01-6 TaxID=3028686 RepID=UPI0029B14480|nr:transposase [Streptomyces sp. ME19-01-6]MDX3228738.1 transposase [Streptomyces sp. ME19-01-6]
MLRAYKFLLRPTVRQAQALTEMLRDHCSLYNEALQERRDAWRHASKTSIRYGDQSAQLREIRAFDAERQGRWSFSSQQATLRRLDKAFQAFFRRVRSGGKPGYPRFKGVGHFDTVVFPKDGDGCRWDSTPHAMAEELAEAQRYLSTFPRRIRRRTKKHKTAARKVAKLHARIRRQRLDHHHKRALALVREHDVIAHEKLNTAGMTKAPAPKPDPHRDGAFLANGAAAKAGLNRSILDAGWGQFLRILADKAESAGRRVIPVGARNTSITCTACGHVDERNRITQAKFECVSCGFIANADHIGALNVLNRAGLVLCDAA